MSEFLVVPFNDICIMIELRINGSPARKKFHSKKRNVLSVSRNCLLKTSKVPAIEIKRYTYIKFLLAFIADFTGPMTSISQTYSKNHK